MKIRKGAAEAFSKRGCSASRKKDYSDLGRICLFCPSDFSGKIMGTAYRSRKNSTGHNHFIMPEKQVYRFFQLWTAFLPVCIFNKAVC